MLEAGEQPMSAEDASKTVYIKDMRVIEGVPLSDTVIVDNSLLSFALQPDNGIPISSYFYDPKDQELRCLANYLIGKLALMDDIRVVNREEFKLQNIIELAIKSNDISVDDSNVADGQQSMPLQQSESPMPDSEGQELGEPSQFDVETQYKILLEKSKMDHRLHKERIE